MSEQICKKIPKLQMGNVISPKGIKTPRIRFKEQPATSATYPKKRVNTIPKAQEGSVLLQDFEKFRTSPEGKDTFRMMEENRIAKKRSGRIDYSEVDPITDVLLGAGIAKTLGRKIVKPSTTSGILPEWIRLEGGRVRDIPSGVKMSVEKDVKPLLADFTQRVRSPEGQRRLANLGRSNDIFKKVNFKLKQDFGDPAMTSHKNGLTTVTLNKNVLKEDIGKITRHELEHVIQNRRQSPIDYELADLELRRYHPDLIDKGDPDTMLNYADYYRAEAGRPIASKKYFQIGSDGREKSAMLAELQQHLLDTKQISHAYASNEITPQLMERVYNANKQKIGGFPTRILSIMEPTQKNFNILSSGLNKMLTTTGVTAGIAAKEK